MNHQFSNTFFKVKELNIDIIFSCVENVMPILSISLSISLYRYVVTVTTFVCKHVNISMHEHDSITVEKHQ